MDSTSFRIRLQQELVQRCKNNQRYSLRAFADHLDLDPSTLSKILKGKRSLGRKSILQLGSRIGLSVNELEPFLTPESQNAESEALTQYRQLAMDQFAIVSDWHHFAILELMSLKSYKSESGWMAKALGISKFEVEEALERLCRVGLIAKNKSGHWKDTSAGYTTGLTPDMTSTAQQKLQKQFLEKAIEALMQVPIEYRDHTSVTMAIDRAKLPEAKRKIQRFRRSLGEFLTQSTATDEVYNLNIALFPLTKTTQRSTQ